MPLTKEWFSAGELALLQLPGIPTEKKNILLRAERERWNHPGKQGTWWRPRQGRGGRIEFHFSVLPPDAATIIAHKFQDLAAVEQQARDLSAANVAWSAYARRPDTQKEVARRRLMALDAIDALIAGGQKRTIALQLVAAEHKVKISTLYNWQKMVAGVPRVYQLAYLIPNHTGRAPSAASSDAAWEFLRADYLRLSRPDFRSCYRRLQAAAAEQGWTIPSEDTLQRRMPSCRASSSRARALARRRSSGSIRTWSATAPHSTPCKC